MITIMTKNDCLMFNFNSYEKEIDFCSELTYYKNEKINKKVRIIFPRNNIVILEIFLIELILWEERRFLEKIGIEINNLIKLVNEKDSKK